MGGKTSRSKFVRLAMHLAQAFNHQGSDRVNENGKIAAAGRPAATIEIRCEQVQRSKRPRVILGKSLTARPKSTASRVVGISISRSVCLTSTRRWLRHTARTNICVILSIVTTFGRWADLPASTTRRPVKRLMQRVHGGIG